VIDKTDSNKSSQAAKEGALNKPWMPPRRIQGIGVGPNGPLSKAEQAALPGWGAAPAICLVQPQMGENIGATARAMANFGFSELILVSPRDVWPNPKAWALASGAEWPLENARVVDSAAQAIGDKTLVIATTGTPRQLDKPLIGPREAVARIRAAMANGEQPVILFGSERAGLDNDLIINADILVTYPVDGRFPSLNLAQSVACFCYEWASFSEAEGPPPGWTMSEQPAAPRHAFESFFENLISELDDSRFFWPDDRKTTMVETMRNALVRGRFTMGEISLIRGAMRSLVEGPRRRSIESDKQRAREVFQAWLDAGANGAANMAEGEVVEFIFAGTNIVARMVFPTGTNGAWFVTLVDWKVETAQFVGSA
jgi:tRNA/rRNA methyltransferase